MNRDDVAGIIDEAALAYERRFRESVSGDARRFLLDRISEAVVASLTPERAPEVEAAAIRALQTASAFEARARYDDATDRAGFGPAIAFLETPASVQEHLAAMGPVRISGTQMERISLPFWPFNEP